MHSAMLAYSRGPQSGEWNRHIQAQPREGQHGGIRRHGWLEPRITGHLMWSSTMALAHRHVGAAHVVGKSELVEPHHAQLVSPVGAQVFGCPVLQPYKVLLQVRCPPRKGQG